MDNIFNDLINHSNFYQEKLDNNRKNFIFSFTPKKNDVFFQEGGGIYCDNSKCDKKTRLLNKCCSEHKEASCIICYKIFCKEEGTYSCNSCSETLNKKYAPIFEIEDIKFNLQLTNLNSEGGMSSLRKELEENIKEIFNKEVEILSGDLDALKKNITKYTEEFSRKFANNAFEKSLIEAKNIQEKTEKAAKEAKEFLLKNLKDVDDEIIANLSMKGQILEAAAESAYKVAARMASKASDKIYSEYEISQAAAKAAAETAANLAKATGQTVEEVQNVVKNAAKFGFNTGKEVGKNMEEYSKQTANYIYDSLSKGADNVGDKVDYIMNEITDIPDDMIDFAKEITGDAFKIGGQIISIADDATENMSNIAGDFISGVKNITIDPELKDSIIDGAVFIGENMGSIVIGTGKAIFFIGENALVILNGILDGTVWVAENIGPIIIGLSEAGVWTVQGVFTIIGGVF